MRAASLFLPGLSLPLSSVCWAFLPAYARCVHPSCAPGLPACLCPLLVTEGGTHPARLALPACLCPLLSPRCGVPSVPERRPARDQTWPHCASAWWEFARAPSLRGCEVAEGRRLGALIWLHRTYARWNVSECSRPFAQVRPRCGGRVPQGGARSAADGRRGCLGGCQG